jgi:L-fuculose-phosphate aldolase
MKSADKEKKMPDQLLSEPAVEDSAGTNDAPELDDRAELAVLHRRLHRIGFCDGTIAGHISMRLDDGTMLITGRGFGWDEMRASRLVRIDQQGHVFGNGIVGDAARTLHGVIHERRPDIRVAVHHHPVWASVWAAAGQVPPVLDQLGSFATDDLVVTGAYQEDASHRGEAESYLKEMGAARTALLRSHGVLVLAESVRQALLKCAALEHRCRLAWHARVLGEFEPMAKDVSQKLAAGRDTPAGMRNLFEYATRRELADDPSVLE